MAGLRPLEDWICDTCGEVIAGPDAGWIEWSPQAGSVSDQHEFRIVHHASASPRKPNGDCYSSPPMRLSRPLKDTVGVRATAFVFSLIDPGQHLVAEYPGPQVANLRELVEIGRRLLVPHYEEARQYFVEAQAEGIMAEWNEATIYNPGELRGLIARYKP